ncbi:MAG: hypothetical protein V7K26_23175 [Nostoc sp.]
MTPLLVEVTLITFMERMETIASSVVLALITLAVVMEMTYLMVVLAMTTSTGKAVQISLFSLQAMVLIPSITLKTALID